jgi:hydrophobic/amphiphilic exporter-1 (mainly G- bacteria), HAE1 family
MNQLAALCVKRPVFATVLILVFVVFGVFGYMKLGVDRFPKVDFPIITVTTRLPGSAPEEVETEITDKIEEAVNTVNGIEELRSVSSEGISQVFIQFVLEKDVDVAAQDVRDKVNRAMPELPRDVEQPTVEKLDPDAMPVLTIAVSAPEPTTLRDITEYCDKVLRRQLESIGGVGQVMIVGGQARQINVQLDPLKLRAQKLTVADVSRALASQNLQMPSGSMKVGDTQYTLRTMGRVQNMQQMEAIAVANVAGRTITIGDLGRCEDSTEELQSASLYDDTPCVLLNIRKQSGTNTVEVAGLLKERLKELTKIAPQGYDVEIVRDQSVFIEAAVDTVKEHLIVGGILAAVIVFVFLTNIRATLIAALSIPTSIIAAFAVVKYMGFTLNSLTLLALTLSVGIVIDDAIVVMENIFRYIEEKKYTPFQAAVAATGEIGLAVMAITLSLIAVFLPIAMMEGIVGMFLKSFGITMAATILVSMLVSFTLTPMLAARWFKGPADDSANEGGGAAAIAGGPAHGGEKSSKGQVFYRVIEELYLAVLRFSLRNRWVVVLATVCCLLTLPVLLKVLPKNFLPDDDSSDFQVNLQAPEGTSLEATRVLVSRLAREIRQLDGVRYTIASVGDTEQRNPYQGTVYVRLVNIAQRDYGQLQLMDFVRKNIVAKFVEDYASQSREAKKARAAGPTGSNPLAAAGAPAGQKTSAADDDEADRLRISVSPAAVFSGGGMSTGDVQYMIGGPDMAKLTKYARKIMKDLRAVPGAVDVDSSLSMGKPQYGVTIDRAKAAEMGVSVSDVANTLRLLVAGDKVTDYNEKGEQYEVHVRAVADVRNRLDELAMITVPSYKLGTVPLGDVVRFDQGTGPAQIDRLARTRQVTINANLTPGTSQQTVLDAIAESAKDLDMGPEYTTGLLGKSKEMAKTFRAFFLAFILAFIFVYLCIAAQFESWLHPITILLSLPLTLPFALLSLVIFQQSLNIFSLLGILVLFAVVKKNSILQIDHTNQLRAAGMPRFEAMIAANRDRLRPILMTTVAFVAGMAPTLLSNAEGAATNKAISGVIVGGQTLSLLLTLLATPVAYSLFDDLSAFFWRLFRRRPASAAADSIAGELAPPAPAPGGNGDTLWAKLGTETFVAHRDPTHEQTVVDNG